MCVFARMIAAAAVATACTACGMVVGYRGEAIEGRVIDATTRQPVEGVIVVARWHLRELIHGAAYGNLQLEDTVTAADGRFQFDAWGPRRGKFLTRHDPKSPWLFFIKPGYASRLLVNDEYAPGALADPRASRWNGTDVELREPREFEIKHPLLVSLDFTLFYGDGGCSWQKIPRLTVMALRHPDPTIRGKMPTLRSLWSGHPALDPYASLEQRPPRDPLCDDPREVLKEFL